MHMQACPIYPSRENLFNSMLIMVMYTTKYLKFRSVSGLMLWKYKRISLICNIGFLTPLRMEFTKPTSFLIAIKIKFCSLFCWSL